MSWLRPAKIALCAPGLGKGLGQGREKADQTLLEIEFQLPLLLGPIV